MRAHRIISLGEAAPDSRHVSTRPVGPHFVAFPGRETARRAGCCIAAVLALGAAVTASPRAAAAMLAPALRPAGAGTTGPGRPATVVMAAGPADAVVDPEDGTPGMAGAAAPSPEAVAAPRAAGPLGRAAGMLAAPHTRGRARHAPEPMPGCTGMATLDGVSAALQAGPFGRGKGLAIMQFRNVVTDSAEDGRVACHSDVLLSDGSLHRAEFGLRRVRRGTRLHIEVAGEREGTGPAASGTPAPEPPVPEPPGAVAPLPPTEQPTARVPAT